jgi:metallophosphoesterase superfamily enzyme
MALHFLPDGPALVVENTMRILVIADLHIGIESDLDLHGIHIPSQGQGRLDRVLTCIEEGRPDLVLLLGDVKHSVPLTTRQEYREIPALLQEIRSRAALRMVPGNHDGGIERFLRDGELLPMRGAILDGVGYLHGHTYPDPSLLGHLLVIGHHHPMVALRDGVGCALRDRAYLLTSVDEECLGLAGNRGRKGEGGPDEDTEGIGEKPGGSTRILVMPAFNEFTGFDITRLRKSSLGPLSRCMDFANAEVFLTDGTYLGLLGCLGEE